MQSQEESKVQEFLGQTKAFNTKLVQTQPGKEELEKFADQLNEERESLESMFEALTKEQQSQVRNDFDEAVKVANRV